MQEGAQTYWARNGNGNVVFFDTTHRTNRYCAKIGCFTTVGPNGDTIILAVYITMEETTENFVWAFDQFRECFKPPPAVLITDGDPKMAAAKVAVFPASTKHHLCIYHLSLNFAEHIKKCFADMKDYKVVLDAFWRLAKETDERTANDDSFNEEFDQIVSFVEVSGAAEKTVTDAVDWLNTKLRDRKEMWAARYTWAYFTFGAHSTEVRGRRPGAGRGARAAANIAPHVALVLTCSLRPIARASSPTLVSSGLRPFTQRSSASCMPT
ncbi:MAG: hypothetical protein AAGF86_14090 [Pseudomonadota bacterium]